MTTGTLAVVGTGIQTTGQLTHEARACIGAADAVYHLVADPVARGLIDRLAPGRHHDLATCYVDGRPRREAYDAMLQIIVDSVIDVDSVCAAFYGHPGVYSTVAHEAVQAVRAAGGRAFMLPGISATDCLVADLLVDPGQTGVLSLDASDFLVNRRVLDPSAALVLWQVGKVAIYDAGPASTTSDVLEFLASKLIETYSASHVVTLYRAAMTPGVEAEARSLRLDQIGAARPGPGHTLYVPPARLPSPDHRFDHLRP